MTVSPPYPQAAGAFQPTLDNCADEPIHIPGSIQPHGAMLVFNHVGELLAWSANLPAELALQQTPVLGMSPAQLGLCEDVCALIAECMAEMDGGEAPPMMLETAAGEVNFDCIIHAHQSLVIVEYERRTHSSEVVSSFALKAHAGIERLKRQKSIIALLQTAVDQVRESTGFDRVMAYRFRHDDSGDVVAEAREAGLDPYLGRRYPASDIPAQARRLYTLSTLRLISDVGYAPVPILGRTGAAPVDMSFCVLRSVSPIHIEYLQNMGVHASMSISIVINGKLWGLIACHHMTARQVPYSIRMAADVMAQVLASAIHTLELKERTALVEHAAEVRTRVMESLLHQDDVMAALTMHAADIANSLGAQALLVLHSGRVHIHGDVPADQAAAIAGSVQNEDSDFIERSTAGEWPLELQKACGSWIGALGIRFDLASAGWLIALRPEQAEMVRWAGRPEKAVKSGPLGDRLTPRGSFDEWRQTVVGKAEPWEPTRLLIARQLLSEMNRASLVRHDQNEKARAYLLAMLGHDLRNPLQTISMAASVLELGGAQQMVGQRIKASSGRMERLISQVLDLSLINGGLRLGSSAADIDLIPVVHDVVDEFRTAKPGIAIQTNLPPSALVRGDRDRIAQVISNLISNANHHGKANAQIDIDVRLHGETTEFTISNIGDEIDELTGKTLYDPFKRMSVNNARNKGGMGLGLHISKQILIEHGATIEYSYAAPHVTFTVRFPNAAVGQA
ncbi:MAG TPA: ATP-binding protein [Telluria sp.]|nr:ATP-binding protein [Telluria sp.]